MNKEFKLIACAILLCNSSMTAAASMYTASNAQNIDRPLANKAPTGNHIPNKKENISNSNQSSSCYNARRMLPPSMILDDILPIRVYCYKNTIMLNR